MKKASYQLKENIRAMLRARHQTSHDLAFGLGHDDSWASKFLSDKPLGVGEKPKGVPLAALDEIAGFFGVSVYQLFQPGISHLTERRTQTRRVQPERRITATTGARPTTPTRAIRATPEDERILTDLHGLTYDQYQHVRAWIQVAKYGPRSTELGTSPRDEPPPAVPQSDEPGPRLRVVRKRKTPPTPK